jgi:general secretion pathway protein A
MAFYGLHDPPFELSSDPRFFFHSTPHDHVAQQLLTAIRNREGMAVLTGDEGMGKTTLCRAVMEQLDRRTLTSLVTDPFISGEGLLEKVLADFGVMSQDELSRGPNATRDDLSSTLKSFLESLAALDAAAVVIIDDAHELPRDVLELICRLSEPGSRPAPPQIVLVGKPSLRALLQRSEHRRLNERVKVWCHLGPLPEDELGAYLVHRLAVAGNAPRVRFDDSGLAYLHRISKGVPRVANLVCDRALVRGFEASAHLVDRALIQKAEADLNLGRPRSASRSVLALMAAGVLFVLLVLAGGAAAAWVFQDAVSRGITRWERVPPPPRPPSRKLPLPARAGESVRVGDSVQAR